VSTLRCLLACAVVGTALHERIGPTRSGFIPLDANEEGLAWWGRDLPARAADTLPTKAEFMGLHVKAMAIDRQRVFIGSMNLDPRSAEINSEMGVIVDSPGPGEQLARAMERDMAMDDASRLTLDASDHGRWTAGDSVLTTQPARNVWQRIEDVIFMAFPRDLY
jgi:putative cardiolipin synthase